MNFKRDKQMIIHDPRLYGRRSDNARIPLYPPDARHRWTVNPSEPLSQILDQAAFVASEDGKLDALHIMAHGYKGGGGVQLGADGVSMGNAHLWLKMTDKARVIVFWSCEVGADIKPGEDNSSTSLGCAIAQITKAKVLVCKELQWFNYNATSSSRGGAIIDFGAFEGDVYLCYPGGGHMVVYKSSGNGKAQIDIETYIFGG